MEENKKIDYIFKENDYFKENDSFKDYFEIFSEDFKKVKIVFRSQETLNLLNSKNRNNKIDIKEKLENFDEIIIIFDYDKFSLELDTQGLRGIIEIFLQNIDDINKTKLSLIIKNSYINPEKDLTQISFDEKLILNRLEISDELYSFSTNLNYLFPNLKVKELALKKFKYQSKEQLLNFCKFIFQSDCKSLTLDDIFIELIIKNSENDEEYKDLDIYFSYISKFIVLNSVHTFIHSLVLRDSPLFAMIGNMFKYNESKELININIDIDENSLINPSIITKFKIKDGAYDITFDLDSYKIKKEEDDNNGNDYIDYLIYIFNIIISEKNVRVRKEEERKNEEDEDDLREIDRKNLHRLTFKNFDMTKYEYITGDEKTFIDEKMWVLNEEEKNRKNRWEDFTKKLESINFESLNQVQELIFYNCSNFFIQWILKFVKGTDNKIKSNNFDFNLLKLKKCGKDYINLEKILQMKINQLILFDTPLIIGENFPPENHAHLSNIKGNLGTIDYLTIKINSLDSYGRQYNLNTYRTYEILVELIQNKNFNNNITFEFNALQNIMTFLATKEYSKDPKFYRKSDEDEEEEEEEDDDKEDETEDKKMEKQKHNIKTEYRQLPIRLYFDSKEKRDIIYKAFNLNSLKDKTITLKNMKIKAQIENFENLNDLKKIESNELKKIEFGSDGFYIDLDYKFFFSENQIRNVELINVSFSNYKDNTPQLKKIQEETIINLISQNKYEKDLLNGNNIHFPNYKIDMKTLNEILYKNYLFEDVGVMFKYFLYKIDEQYREREREVNPDIIEKKLLLSDYFKNFSKIFENFNKNIQKLTIVINNIREIKELYITFCVLRILNERNNFINEALINRANKNKITVPLPDKKILEKNIGKYFIKEEIEKDKECYSEINCYYSSPEEIEMLEKKVVKINNYEFYIENKIDNYFELI